MLSQPGLPFPRIGWCEFPDAAFFDLNRIGNQEQLVNDDTIGASNDLKEIDWHEIMRRMEAYAERKMASTMTRTGDFNDAVSSALRTLFRRRELEVNPPETTKMLWKVIFTTLNKKIQKYRDANRSLKNQALRESDTTTENQHFAWVNAFAIGQPTPEDIQKFIDAAMGPVLAVTDDPEEIECCKLTLMAYRPSEIAETTTLSESQVRRRLDRIRNKIARCIEGSPNG